MEVEVDPLAWERIGTLWKLWQSYGRSLNLTADLREDVLRHHVGEGLQTARCAQLLGNSTRSWLDIGAGGGFPGLIVSTLWRGPMVFVEPGRRRSAFLEFAVKSISTELVRVVRGRVEALGWVSVEGTRLEGRFDIVSGRAVFQFERWPGIAQTWADPRGFILIHCKSGEMLPWPVQARVEGDRYAVAAVSCSDVSRET